MLLITAHNEYCIHLLQNKQNYYCVSVSILNRFMSTNLSFNHSQSQPTLARTTANRSQPQLEQQPIVANLSQNHSQLQPTLARTTANRSQPQLEQQPILANLSLNHSQSQPTLARVSSSADRVCQALKQKKNISSGKYS